MIQDITRKQAARIINPVFRNYAGMYLDIYDDFIKNVESFGLPFHQSHDYETEAMRLLPELQRSDIVIRNNGASLVYNRISPACEACKKGIGTMTSYISFQCHRHCFFCFNPNQDNFEIHCSQKKDACMDLEKVKKAGGRLTHVALTGGEPLLHPQDSIAFFQKAKQLFPDAHTRLYTSGDLLTPELLKQLQKAGLDEIRFSYKIEDAKKQKEKVLSNIELAGSFIPAVMVEMPVMPDAGEEMKYLLKRLDDMDIFGINLLELCFPYYNAEAFRSRGYELKYPPYRTLYNYWYAGGLPVAGSELSAYRLLLYAAEHRMKPGIHYCSLENKNFGQIYQQNRILCHGDSTMYFSERDYYLKTIKAFGDDAVQVCRIFEKAGVTNYIYDKKNQFIQFHPDNACLLNGSDIELAVSVNVMEMQEGVAVSRELKLQLAAATDCHKENL